MSDGSRLLVRHDVLAANLRAIRSAVGDDVRLLLPVKADAYGHGAVAVATRVEAAGLADWFGVATLAEARELRAAGVTRPVLKFSPVGAWEADDLGGTDVVATVAAPGDADVAEGAARRAGRPLEVHLKVDSGMGRLGVGPDAAGDLAAHVRRACPNLRVTGAYTHLAASDDPAYDDATAAQLAGFARARADLERALGQELELVHAANSGGVLAHPDSWLSMVRPGIMSYGYSPDPATPRTVPVEPVVEWRARLTYVKRVAAGTSVGYGRTWSAPGPTTIGTVALGYADGLNRHLSNAGRMIAGEGTAPVVGRVCMDMTMIDLGPDPAAGVGDEVVVLGRRGGVAYTAEDMARDLGTIPYEITCGIGSRVTRVHLDGPGAAP